MKKVCTNCQRFAGENENFCNICGGRLTAINDGPSAPVMQPQPQPRPVFHYDEKAEKGKSRGVASAIFGSFGLFFSIVYIMAPCGFILSIVGLCLSSSSKKLGFTGGCRKAGKGLSIAGLILSSIIIAAFIVITTLFLIYGDTKYEFSSGGNDMRDFFQTIESVPEIRSV